MGQTTRICVAPAIDQMCTEGLELIEPSNLQLNEEDNHSKHFSLMEKSK